MELRVLGCHGGETSKHRTTAFLLDGTLAVDAGALSGVLSLDEQQRLRACVVGHAHLDHIRDLATLVDNRCQSDVEPLVVAATAPTLAALRAHFFNDIIWPDFSRLPSPDAPALRFVELPLAGRVDVAGYEIETVPVHHTVASSGFVVRRGGRALGFTGDTGPTDAFWRTLAAEPDLAAVLAEVSFPNGRQALASVSGHHTPATLATDLRKLPRPEAVPTLLYHIKPAFQGEVERECAALRGLALEVLSLGDEYVL